MLDFIVYQQDLETYHIVHKVDFTAVKAGFITKESYYQRYFKINPISYTTDELKIIF
jgi:hypothetical protein